jgi:hypothetical protein
MTAERSREQRLPAGPSRGLAGLLSAVLLLTACARVGDELPRVVPAPTGAAGVAMPELATPSPAPCTTSPPEVPAASTAAGNRPDTDAVAEVQRYLDTHPDVAGSLIIDVTVPGSAVHAGFVSGWCRHQKALRQLVGAGTRVGVFAVVQSDRAGRQLADRVMAATAALRGAGIPIATAGVDPRSGLTSITTPHDPAEARAAILRTLELPATAPIMVSSGDLPVPAIPSR